MAIMIADPQAMETHRRGQADLLFGAAFKHVALFKFKSPIRRGVNRNSNSLAGIPDHLAGNPPFHVLRLNRAQRLFSFGFRCRRHIHCSQQGTLGLSCRHVLSTRKILPPR
jgi:hypothetical protein